MASDLISRKALITKFWEYTNGEKQRYLIPEDIWEMVELFPAVEPMKWIPCSERMPECEWGAESEALLYQTRAAYIHAGYFGRGGLLRDAYFREFADPREGCDASSVIAWMPLPEPYKDGDIDG